MCLIINLGKHPTLEPIQLNEDITVYKVVHRIATDSYITPFRRMYIHFNSSNLFVTNSYSKELFQVASNLKSAFGYHAFSSLYWARDMCKSYKYTTGYVILKCIVPKGAYVYFGEGGEICCSQLIIHNEICI